MSSLMSDSRYCNGNVKPNRFVKQDTTARMKVLQATDGSGSHGDQIFGISDQGVWQPPLVIPGGSQPLDDGYVGTASSPPITVWKEGAEVYILSGASFSVDDRLKADSDGRGITASVTADNVGAIALEAATAANQRRLVRIIAPAEKA